MGVCSIMRLIFKVVYPPTGSRPRQGVEHPAYAVLWSMAHLPASVAL